MADIDNLSNTVERVEATYNSVLGQLRNYQRQYAEQEVLHAQMQREIQELQARLRDRQQEIDAHGGQVAAIAAIENQLRTCQAALQTAERRIAELEQQIAARQTELDNLGPRLEELNNRLGNALATFVQQYNDLRVFGTVGFGYARGSKLNPKSIQRALQKLAESQFGISSKKASQMARKAMSKIKKASKVKKIDHSKRTCYGMSGVPGVPFMDSDSESESESESESIASESSDDEPAVIHPGHHADIPDPMFPTYSPSRPQPMSRFGKGRSRFGLHVNFGMYHDPLGSEYFSPDQQEMIRRYDIFQGQTQTSNDVSEQLYRRIADEVKSIGIRFDGSGGYKAKIIQKIQRFPVDSRDAAVKLQEIAGLYLKLAKREISPEEVETVQAIVAKNLNLL